MSDEEQEEIIQKLRDKVVRIDSNKPSSAQDVKEEDVIQKAQEAGETIDDDAIYADNN